MEKEKFINLQLFGENQDPQKPEVENSAYKQLNEKTKDLQKTNSFANETSVSKELFDKKMSEMAELSRKLKEYENTIKEYENINKTAEQKAQDALAELEQAKAERQRELDELTIKFNKASAIADISEIRGKLKLSDSDKDIDTLIEHLVELDADKTKSKVSVFKGLLESVYNKGFETAKQGGWNAMSNNIASGQPAQSKSAFAKYQESAIKSDLTQEVKF
jgi:hypothetical protein